MKNKTVANFAFAAAAVVASTITTFKVDPAIDHSKDEILAPATVEAGALTIFSTVGKDVQWDIYPEILSQPFGEHDSSLATSFQVPGDYLVVCSWLDDEGKVQLRKHPIHVKPFGQTPAPTPAPVLPDPRPPVVNPDTSDTSFPDVAAEVEIICRDTLADVVRCCELARNFTTIANKIASGDYTLVAAVLRDTAALNKRVAKVDETSTRIQLLVSRKRYDGLLGNVAAYEDLWRQLARGLSNYGGCEE